MARPGRKRKAGVKREASGKVQRPNRDTAEQEAMSAAMEARRRVFGLKPHELLDQMAGSFVGRLCINEQISVSQYDAAMTFLEDHRNNAIAIAAPRDPSAMDFNKVQGGSLSGENVDFYKRATKRWRDAVSAVQDRQNELRGGGAVYAALQYCVLEDKELHHLLGWLREGLNSLVRHYGLVDKVKAA